MAADDEREERELKGKIGSAEGEEGEWWKKLKHRETPAGVYAAPA